LQLGEGDLGGADAAGSAHAKPVQHALIPAIKPPPQNQREIDRKISTRIIANQNRTAHPAAMAPIHPNIAALPRRAAGNRYPLKRESRHVDQPSA